MTQRFNVAFREDLASLREGIHEGFCYTGCDFSRPVEKVDEHHENGFYDG